LGRFTHVAEVVRFTKKEWKEVVSVLPQTRRLQSRSNRMRLDVESHLNYFLKYRKSLWTARKTKRSVNKIQSYAIKLERELELLIEDPIFLTAGLAHGRISDLRIHPLLPSLEQLQREMEGAEGRLSMRPGRKSVKPTDFLITFLNQIQHEATREQVARSNKRTNEAKVRTFIEVCCRKVGLSKGQVDRSLKRTITISHVIYSTGNRTRKHP
jgi:hypothetical protein